MCCEREREGKEIRRNIERAGREETKCSERSKTKEEIQESGKRRVET